MVYNNVPKEKIMKIHSFVMEKRKEFGYGQRKLSYLEKKDFIVPEKYGTIVPFRAGKSIAWSIIK